MCGIAGMVNLDGRPVVRETLQNMTDAITHRGPDGEGHWIDGNIGLGHRRLAIIDLSPAGHQPMITGDGRFVLSYNGEVYNFRELRKELEMLGHSFRGNSDSEVVLKSIAHWGNDAFLKFNGMFALAFWDAKDRKLLLARDRYGVKPLYYSKQDNTLYFASEQKAFTGLTSFRKEINKPALLEYFTFQNLFTSQTLLKDVELLKPGHYLEVFLGSSNTVFNINCYWDYRFREPEQQKKPQEYLEELDRLFNQAVKRQLIGDVELGAYLSGGMDSGSITAIAANKFPNLKSFTCGFDLSSASGIELAFDERVNAEAMSASFKTEHYEMVLKAGDMERCLPRLAWHLEEPRVGQSYPNYYAAYLASKFVKVVLSGTGGDELFGGYPWRYYRAANCQNFEDYVNQYYGYWQRLLSNTQIKQMFAPVWGDVKDVWTRDIFRDVFATHDNELKRPEDYINHSLYFEAKTFLHGLFVVEDKLSMAHGLETRVPFMDNDLVDFAMQCPVSLKLNNLSNVLKINENDPRDKQGVYFQKTNDGKQILRDVMRRYIPEDVVKREKQGFSSPDASWFKGDSINFVKMKLLNKNANIYNFFDRATITSLLGEHLQGSQNRRLLIWSLLNIEVWLESF
ncbi:asparagine synthase (glutamine-hydrolyzing) [Polynucleobacter difficilis]|uniref:asparagine synthase (glutamine-hydrolyzing) n=1 Tax=Polynucleobacter difficilis TaxID=556054 RepID=UPI000D386603|nr:asparagine synthase (glutamine-hydrolyzing) [Polynucleobacter difficilis]